MPDDRDERIERLERAVLLLAEIVERMARITQDHDHTGGGGAVGLATRMALDRERSRLDAICGPIGPGRDETTGGGR